MVDYGALRKQKGHTSADPIEIFKRLPKSQTIKDLFAIQRTALQQWYERKGEKDVVVKLNTGGGKTLVGLLIAQSIMNESHGPVLYLCPNWQLADQTLDKAREVGISAHRYERRVDTPEFLNGQSIMVAPYQALFHGQSKFGLLGRVAVPLKGIILDDAHAALPILRQQFTFKVENDVRGELYLELAGLFRNDFANIRKDGVLDAVVQDKDPTVLEVPYWAWKTKENVVSQMITNAAKAVADQWPDFDYHWPLLRDELDVCYALISARAFSIVPMYPITDLFPSFSECPSRVYMSATLPDDSAIIRTFDATPSSIQNPVMPTEATNVGERMILVPALTRIRPENQQEVIQRLIENVSHNWYKGQGAGVVILVPSGLAAQNWKGSGTIALGDDVAKYVLELQSGKSRGPFIFANRYDGIDLPGNACRLLILAGLPKGIDDYDTYLSGILGEGSALRGTIGQRVEQGAGRSTRGAGDFSIVLFVGADLAAWIGTSTSLDTLTAVTRAQIEMGLDISGAISDEKQLTDTVLQCLGQDPKWRRFHAEALADLAEPAPINRTAVEIASSEREFFRLLRRQEYQKAVILIEEVANRGVIQDSKQIGWLLQLAARAAHFGNLEDKSTELQTRAYGANPTLFMPKLGPKYIVLETPGQQAELIVKPIMEYSVPRAYLSYFEQVASHLSPNVSSNQFEEALKNLGRVLGFNAQRPDHDYDQGPDVLWLLEPRLSFVMEAKSNKNPKNALTKKEHEQLLEAFEWFRAHYPTQAEGVKISVHPNALASKEVTPNDTMVLTLDNLSILVSNVRELLTELCSSDRSDEASLRAKCELRLRDLELKPAQIRARFLVPLAKAK